MDWGRVGLGVATGGASETTRAAMGLLKGGGGSGGDPYSMLTPEQHAAMSKLAEFMNSGKFGDFQAGADVGLGYGDFNTTDSEKTGLTALQRMLAAGLPDQYAQGDAALSSFLNPSPDQIKTQFDPFKAGVNRQIGESNAALKRGAGFAGSLYSTSTIKGLGDIQARGNETLASQLANLTNQQLDRKLQSVPLAYQSAKMQQDSALQQIDASQTYGDLTRKLNDASIKARDAELLRRRQELQLPIQAAQGLAGQNVQWGTTPVQSSPYQDLLSLAGQIGGQYLGGKIFAAGMGKVGTGAAGASGAVSPMPGQAGFTGPVQTGFGDKLLGG